GPGDLRVGVDHGRDNLGVKSRFFSGAAFRRYLALVGRTVRQLRLSGYIADGEDMIHIGTALVIDRYESPIIDFDTGIVGTDLLATWFAADTDQHTIIFGVCRRILAFEAYLELFLSGFDTGHFGADKDIVAAFGHPLVQWLDQVTIRA